MMTHTSTILPTQTSQPSNPKQSQTAPKVLFVLGMLWGENGITSHLQTLGKGLISQGWEVAIATGVARGVDGATEESQLAIQRLTDCGIQYFPVSFPSLHLSLPNLSAAVQAVQQLDHICYTYCPNVIHLHALSTSPFIQLVRWRYGIPVISTCHMEPSTQRVNVRLGKKINHLMGFLFGSRVIAVSSTLKEAYEQILRVSPQNIRMVYHGVDAQHYRLPSTLEKHKARQAYGLTDADQVICLIGRLESKKGHRLLFEAIAKLQADNLHPIVLCAGKGYENEMEIVANHAKVLGINEQVKLLGFTDTRQVLWASDISVLPSAEQSEAFGLVIPEAMLCGVVPIRTPAAGSTDQIKDQVNGYIIPFNDPDRLALRLKQLLSSDELRIKMATASVNLAHQHFTVERMVTTTIDVYQEVM